MDNQEPELEPKEFRFHASRQVPLQERTVSAGAIRIALRKGLRVDLKHVKIDGNINLSAEDVVGDILLENCSLSRVFIKNSNLRGSLQMRACSVVGNVELIGTSIARNLNLSKTTVTGSLSLINCRIASGLSASGIKVRGKLYGADLSVAASASFAGAEFSKDVDLSSALIERTLNLDKATFYADARFCNSAALSLSAFEARFHGDADFDGINIGADASFEGGRFFGKATFIASRAYDQFIFSDSHFHGAAYFDKLRGKDFMSKGADFQSTVSLEDTELEAVLNLGSANFRASIDIDGGSTGDLNFRDSKIEGQLSISNFRARSRLVLNGVECSEVVTIRSTTIDRSVECKNATFEKPLILETISVFGAMDFESLNSPTKFLEGTNWHGVNCGQDINLRSVLSSGPTISIRGSRCGRDIIFDRIVATLLDLAHCTASGNIHGENIECRELDLSDVEIEHDLTISGEAKAFITLAGAQIRGSARLDLITARSIAGKYLLVERDVTFRGALLSSLDFEGATVRGTLDISSILRIESHVDLRRGVFGTVLIGQGVSKSTSDDHRFGNINFEIGEATFSFLRCDPLLLMRLARDSTDRQPYLALEGMLRRRGFEAQADEVYVRGRRAGRSALARGPWLRDVISDCVSSYGLSYVKILLKISLVTLVGTIYFHEVVGAVRSTRNVFGPISITTPCSVARPGWSQSLLLATRTIVPAPFPDSDVAVAVSCAETLWTAKLPAFFAVLSVLVLKASGLILIPIFLAMLAGLLRPAQRNS